MRRRRERGLTREELALWQRAVTDTAPLDPGRAPPAPPAAPPSPPSVPAPRQDAAPRPSRRDPPLAHDRPVGIDRRNFERLKRGQLPIDSVLDLHGRTQDEAHAALERFLSRASLQGLRCVLIVTGKGQAGGGILRHMVPRWLNEGHNRQRVVSYTQAQPGHGGGGALYLLIRRRRHR